MMKSIPLVLFFCVLISSVQAQTYTVESIPNQKLVDGSYVSNPDGILNQTTVQEIDQKLASLE